MQVSTCTLPLDSAGKDITTVVQRVLGIEVDAGVFFLYAILPLILYGVKFSQWKNKSG